MEYGWDGMGSGADFKRTEFLRGFPGSELDYSGRWFGECPYSDTQFDGKFDEAGKGDGGGCERV
jgi:hypothetical protein